MVPKSPQTIPNGAEGSLVGLEMIPKVHHQVMSARDNICIFLNIYLYLLVIVCLFTFICVYLYIFVYRVCLMC